jgi:DNA polymerase-3 subunit gamma/tau
MTYQVLARRYRPQAFAEVIGQAHVTRVLSGAVAAGRVAHGYLFTGPRGVGKTSTARILAKALNCVEGPPKAPCNACAACTEITAGRSLDVLEIDGASSGGIDQVRELRENARYAPSGGRYKLYIIDEVHQVTAHGFNALLKTLEEPPAHVVFVLATTEVQKVPDTIVSRVQRFDFRRLSLRDIEEQLAKIIAEEKFRLDAGALRVLSQRAQGSLRDAEVLLDQVVAASDGGALTRDLVERLLGLTGVDTYLALTERLAAHDAAGALALLDRVLGEGANLGELATGFIEHLRHLLVLSISSDLAPTLGLTDDLVDRYQDQLKSWSKGDAARLLALALSAAREMRRSEFPRVYFELALVEMAELSSTADLRALLARLDALGGGSALPGGAGGGSATGVPPGDPRRTVPPSRRATGARMAAPAVLVSPAVPDGMTSPAAIATSSPATAMPSPIAAPSLVPAVAIGAPPSQVADRPSTRAAAAPVLPPGPAPLAEPAAFEEESASSSPAVAGLVADLAAPAAGAAAADPRWLRVVERIRMRKTSLASLLAEAREVGFAGGVLAITFPAGQSFYRGKVLEPRNMSIITEEVRAEFGPGVRLELARTEGEAMAPGRPPSDAAAGPGAARSASPARFSAGVGEIVERFDGVILD